MTSCEEQVKQRLSLVLCDIIPVPLRKGKKALMPNYRQLASLTEITGYRFRVHGIATAGANTAEAQEVEDERIDDLEGKGVLLLKQRLDEDVAGTGSIWVRRHLLGGDFAQAMQRGCGVEDGDRDLGYDRGDDDGITLRAGYVCKHGEYHTLEESAWLV